MCCSIVVFNFVGDATSSAADIPIWQDKDNYSFEERAADLIAQMTLQEKLSQMISSYSVAIPRLGIQSYAWWNEALHGVSRIGTAARTNPTVIANATSYPIGFSMGGSWDPDLMYRVATAIGDETREVAPGNDRMLTMYSPTINLARDPRWGRTDEAFSEDPYLTAAIASQFVNGLEGKDKQGNFLDPNGYMKVGATIKHYLANNSEVNRLNGTSNLTEQELREYYAYAFRKVIEQSNVTSVMSAYNRIGIKDAAYSQLREMPGGINQYMLDTLLRQTFGFSGYVTSDCDSVHIAVTGTASTTANQKLTSGNGHGWRAPELPTRAITYAEADAWAIMGGADLECNTGYGAGNNSYEGTSTARAAITSGYVTPFGKFTENAVDVDVARLFETRLKLGEFDDKAADKPVSWYNAARERIENNYGANWVFASNNTTAVTMTAERLALAREAAAKSMILLKNDEVQGKKLLPIDVPASGDFKVAVYGHMAKPNTAENFFLGGYSSNRNAGGYAKMVSPFTGISNAIKAVNPGATVDFYKGFTNGTSSTTLTNLDTANIAKAGDYDLVIVIVADDQAAANEGSDRSDILLKGAQSQLITEVAAKNPNIVTVIQAFCSIDTTAFDAVTPALLFSSFNGDRNGEGIADVLMGNYNPSGRTSTVWYANIGQLGAVASGAQTATRSYRLSPGIDGPWQNPYGHATPNGTYSYGLTNGRTYMYYDEASAPNAASGDNLAHTGGPVRYPFGYGLSYTTFDYSNLRVSGLTGANAVNANGVVTLSFDVKNTGAVKGTEVAELYVKTPESLVASDKTYAIKRLKGFEKVELTPGETKTVTMKVPISDLAFYNNSTKKFEVVWDRGAYTFQVAGNSADSSVKLSRAINITGPMVPELSVLSFKPNTAADKAADVPQRLIYATGDTVLPNPTINMSDDVMYGYVNKSNPGLPIPASISISYESNRPSVVSVDADGSIKAVGGGVATITATARDSVSGTTAEGHFVVYVQGEALGYDASLNTITINGAPLSGFNAKTSEYDVNVKGETAVPVVEAVAAYPDDVTVSVAQAASLKGDAVITVTGKDPELGLRQTYTVHFGVQTVTPLIGTCDSSGFTVSSSIRFGDGETSYKLILAVYDPEGRLTYYKTLDTPPVAKNERGVAGGYIDPGREIGPDAPFMTYKAFLWDPVTFGPLCPNLSLSYN
jgi:beta-glucosidase